MKANVAKMSCNLLYLVSFVCDLGQRLHQITVEPRSKQYLLQRLSIAIQWGNVAAVLGTARVGEQDPFWE